MPSAAKSASRAKALIADPIAGTQAPSVDTLAKAEAAAAHLAPTLTAKGTPRKRAPKGTFDRKAWQADAARKRRAKLKAQKESVK